MSGLYPGSKDLQNQYLLLVLVFSSCSFCLACQSSSSTLAFSFHSASCLREFLSVDKSRDRRVQEEGQKNQQKDSELFCSKTKLERVVCYLAPPASLFAPPSTCVGFQAQLEVGLHWRWQHMHPTDHYFPGIKYY